MNVLVAGGAGYIGSHTCVALLERGYKVFVVDNLSNSDRTVINKIEKISNKRVTFFQVDIKNEEEIENIIKLHNISAVMHFAGYKAVKESIYNPIEYYENNLMSTISLLKACSKNRVRKFIFSSSATVYGENKLPFKESLVLQPTTNPYGETKVMSERILKDYSNANPEISLAIMRYFNPVGAHSSGLIGELPRGVPNNVMPFITQVAKGKLRELEIFGTDYNTVDGSGVRDYIHVMDVAEGHIAALEKIGQGVNVYNLGTGKGTSVFELLRAFEKVNNIKIPYKEVEKREGDIPICYADVSKAKNELSWVAKRDVISMCKDAWSFEKRLQ